MRLMNNYFSSSATTDAFASPALETSQTREIPALARRAVETFVRTRRIFEREQNHALPFLQQPAACFVSIKTADKNLRGCIGTIEPAHPTLNEEIIFNAIQAATRDPRFLPVEQTELQTLIYSVDVLSKPEETRYELLDPSAYGVIVEDETRTRRGLLLPDIEGVESVEQQVQIAARKAGISSGANLRLYRFRVLRFRETEN